MWIHVRANVRNFTCYMRFFLEIISIMLKSTKASHNWAFFIVFIFSFFGLVLICHVAVFVCTYVSLFMQFCLCFLSPTLCLRWIFICVRLHYEDEITSQLLSYFHLYRAVHWHSCRRTRKFWILIHGLEAAVAVAMASSSKWW